MAQAKAAYPARLSVDYPDRPLNKLTTFFRIFTIIPMLIIIILISGAVLGGDSDGDSRWKYQYAAGGLVILPTILMLLFRQKYPRWWFDWNLALVKFCYRVDTYFWLLRDEYPSTDEDQAVHIEVSYPDAKVELNRWLPLVKWLLAIPHYIILVFLYIAVLICAVIAWFAILFTGRFPKGMFTFVVGVMQWSLRVVAYTSLLTTDLYPPFALSE